MLVQPPIQQTCTNKRLCFLEYSSDRTLETSLYDSPEVSSIWKTYFLHKTGVSNQEKALHFTKLVNIIRKASVDVKDQHFHKLQNENKDLKNQLSKLKQQKNSCEQKIIQLSNRLYELERGLMLNMPYDFPQQQEGNTTLDQFSAISIDRYDEREKNKLSLFSKKPSLNFQFDDGQVRSQENNQIQEIQQLNLNFLQPNRHPLKQSLQVNLRPTEGQDYRQFIVDINKMKVQTERIMNIENGRLQQKVGKRRTFGACTQKPSLSGNCHADKQNRRFKRIRA